MPQLMEWVDTSVPVGHSYSCSSVIMYKESKSNNVTTDFVHLKINGVQVSPLCLGVCVHSVWEY